MRSFLVGLIALAAIPVGVNADYLNPIILNQNGYDNNSYSNWNNNDTYRTVPGVQSYDASTNTPGWVQNESTGSFHQCTGLGICTD